MPGHLTEHPQQILRDLLYGEWDPTNTSGYDPSLNPFENPEGLLLSRARSGGDIYPSVIITGGGVSSGSETSYDFLTSEGPGQNRGGLLLVTARAEDVDYDDTGGFDSDPYGYDEYGVDGTVSAEDLVYQLAQEVERICGANASGGETPFTYLGSSLVDAPDDTDVTPTVRIEQVEVPYGWLREP